MHNLNTDTMVVVADTFQESVSHILSNLIGEMQFEIKEFIANMVLKEKPYMLLTNEGLERIIGIVFTNPNYRDFLFALVFTFFSRWGEDQEQLDGLINNLSRGITQTHYQLDFNAIPEVLTSRLNNFENTRKILEANKWLVMILLLQLFITIDAKESK